MVMNPNQSDAALMAKSVSDPEAVVVIFERHYATIHRYLARRIGAGPADDVASETFLVAFRRRSRYDQRHDCAAPWLYGIAVNLMRNHRRAERRRLTASIVGELGAGPDLALERVQQQLSTDQRSRLLAAIAGLRHHGRDVLTLYGLAELSYDEIARALGVSPGTVASRLSRARRTLVGQLGRDATMTQFPSLQEATDA